MNMFISILYRIVSDLYHFFLFFTILLIGFAMSYYCLYNGELEGHQWLGESFFTLFHSSLDATFEYREIGKVRSVTRFTIEHEEETGDVEHVRATGVAHIIQDAAAHPTAGRCVTARAQESANYTLMVMLQ